MGFRRRHCELGSTDRDHRIHRHRPRRPARSAASRQKARPARGAFAISACCGSGAWSPCWRSRFSPRPCCGRSMKSRGGTIRSRRPACIWGWWGCVSSCRFWPSPCRPGRWRIGATGSGRCGSPSWSRRPARGRSCPWPCTARLRCGDCWPLRPCSARRGPSWRRPARPSCRWWWVARPCRPPSRPSPSPFRPAPSPDRPWAG